MERAQLVVLIPVGPTCKVDDVRDTIASVVRYAGPSRKILLLDDSQKGTASAARDASPDLVVLEMARNHGKYTGLYLTLCKGLEYARAHYDFDVVLRMDTDALLIGDRPEEDAARFFREHPECGIIGSYRVDCGGEPHDFSWARYELGREVGWTYLVKHPLHLLGGRAFLRTTLRRALAHGYEIGEHCMGGAYFFSAECVSRLQDRRLLSRRELRWSRLQEDQLFGLLIHAAGLKNGDFSIGNLPMGVRWRGLPCPPEELVALGKKVVHSTRFFKEMTEGQIRAFFRARRGEARVPAAVEP